MAVSEAQINKKMTGGRKYRPLSVSIRRRHEKTDEIIKLLQRVRCAKNYCFKMGTL